jgi:hypothetical protein
MQPWPLMDLEKVLALWRRGTLVVFGTLRDAFSHGWLPNGSFAAVKAKPVASLDSYIDSLHVTSLEEDSEPDTPTSRREAEAASGVASWGGGPLPRRATAAVGASSRQRSSTQPRTGRACGSARTTTPRTPLWCTTAPPTTCRDPARSSTSHSASAPRSSQRRRSRPSQWETRGRAPSQQTPILPLRHPPPLVLPSGGREERSQPRPWPWP